MTYFKVSGVQTQANSTASWGAEKQTTLANKLKEWEETCRDCHPLTPTTCITNCRIWKLKSQFRNLNQKIKNSNFVTTLLNTLKNKRRLQVLAVATRQRCSVACLQRELKRHGYYHSQQTILNEYVAPLLKTGLIEDRHSYYATDFGCRLYNIVKTKHVTDVGLPPHSECYEEKALNLLLAKPQTYKDFENIIPPKSVPRVLKRLQRKKLVETPKETDYTFYFKTKRNPKDAKFSPTERRVYEKIGSEGTSARKLAEKAHISLRRTYKYLRRLKGKKLVFARDKPKTFALTKKGFQTALMLSEIYRLIKEFSTAASQVVNGEEQIALLQPDTEKKEAVSLATVEPTRRKHPS